VIVLPPPDWPDLAPTLSDADADPDVAPVPAVDVLSVPLPGLVVGLVDFSGDLAGDFFGVADVLGEADDVPPRASQLTPLDDDDDGEGLGGGVVWPLVAGSDDAPPVDTTVLGLGGGLDASLDEAVGLDDAGGVGLSGELLVFGEVSRDAAGELAAVGQIALGAATGPDTVVVPAALWLPLPVPAAAPTPCPDVP
jgi:hypothetical protein